MGITFVNNESQNMVNVSLWASMGLLNFGLGITLFIQFYLAFVVNDDRDTVFPFSRSYPMATYAMIIVFGLMFFLGTALSRGSMFSFTAAGLTLLFLFVGMFPSAGWMSKTGALAKEGFLTRICLFLASITSLTSVVCSPSAVTRLFLTPLTVLVIAGFILTESHHDLIVDEDTDGTKPSS